MNFEEFYVWIKSNISLTSESLILIQNIFDYAETHQLGIEDLYDCPKKLID